MKRKKSIQLTDVPALLAEQGVFLSYSALWYVVNVGIIKKKRINGRIYIMSSIDEIVAAIRTYGPKRLRVAPKPDTGEVRA